MSWRRGREEIANLRAHVDAPSKLDAAILRTQAKAALTGLGWKPAIANAAVAAPSLDREQTRRSSN